jgi:hypothetical protein
MGKESKKKKADRKKWGGEINSESDHVSVFKSLFEMKGRDQRGVCFEIWGLSFTFNIQKELIYFFL